VLSKPFTYATAISRPIAWKTSSAMTAIFRLCLFGIYLPREVKHSQREPAPFLVLQRLPHKVCEERLNVGLSTSAEKTRARGCRQNTSHPSSLSMAAACRRKAVLPHPSGPNTTTGRQVLFSAHSTTCARARSLSVHSVLTLGTNSGLILLTSRWMLFKLGTRHDA
jgi:hypothetical protein